MRCLHGGSTEAGVLNRLGRGHRHLGRRRWDDPMQATAAQHAEAMWQLLAQDREFWRGLEPNFITGVTRCAI